MIDIIIDTLLDAIKLVPFLFVAFLIIELVEHKLSKKNKEVITKSKRIGPMLGGIIGAFPQCGFSVLATNMYISRLITLGTLIAIYLSTSDEMLLILISNRVELKLIFIILLIKVFIGIICGFIIDLALRKNTTKTQSEDYEICDIDNCHCNDSIIKSSFIHTVKTMFFIIVATFILNVLFSTISISSLEKVFLKNSIFAPFISSVIGLIPTCGASIMLTEFYLSGIISMSSLIAGLLTGSGVAILVLFKSNKNLKENLKILLLVYTIGVFSGVVISLIENFLIA